MKMLLNVFVLLAAASPLMAAIQVTDDFADADTTAGNASFWDVSKRLEARTNDVAVSSQSSVTGTLVKVAFADGFGTEEEPLDTRFWTRRVGETAIFLDTTKPYGMVVVFR
jgi:hypothetical protein